MKLNRTLKLVPVALLALLPSAVLTANAQASSSTSASAADKNFVTTALRVFENHADLHLRRGRCTEVDRRILPLPSVRRSPTR